MSRVDELREAFETRFQRIGDNSEFYAGLDKLIEAARQEGPKPRGDQHLTPYGFLAKWRAHMERAFNLAEWAESAVDVFGDLERAFGAARQEGREEERERCRRIAVKMQEAAWPRLRIGHDEDAAVQEEVAREIAEAIAAPTPSEPAKCGTCNDDGIVCRLCLLRVDDNNYCECGRKASPCPDCAGGVKP